MTNPVRPWSIHRQILWLIGAFGLVVLWLGLFAAFMLQGGFGPGEQTSPPGFAALFGVIFLSACCIYYIAVARRAWTRRLMWIGIAVHGATFVFLLLNSGLLSDHPPNQSPEPTPHSRRSFASEFQVAHIAGSGWLSFIR